MTMIEALLSLPLLGRPALVSGEIAAALKRSPTRFAKCLGNAWLLTDTGRQFLAQFCYGGSAAVATATVRLMVQKDGEPPLFELLLDDGISFQLHRTELHRRLQRIRAANPGIRITYDFRPFSRIG
ncbi:MAG TPA: hypothetical protein VHY82_01285 [Acetobacteraceae bacterium]|nr:hypothetical protein [Acetobacteraceae bacterium]